MSIANMGGQCNSIACQQVLFDRDLRQQRTAELKGYTLLGYGALIEEINVCQWKSDSWMSTPLTRRYFGYAEELLRQKKLDEAYMYVGDLEGRLRTSGSMRDIKLHMELILFRSVCIREQGCALNALMFTEYCLALCDEHSGREDIFALRCKAYYHLGRCLFDLERFAEAQLAFAYCSDAPGFGDQAAYWYDLARTFHEGVEDSRWKSEIAQPRSIKRCSSFEIFNVRGRSTSPKRYSREASVFDFAGHAHDSEQPLKRPLSDDEIVQGLDDFGLCDGKDADDDDDLTHA